MPKPPHVPTPPRPTRDAKADDSEIRRRDFLAGASAFSVSALLGCLPNKAALAIDGPDTKAPAGSPIASLAIFPAIGICRVGNSRRFFLAPEVPGLAPRPEGGFKDGPGLIKKQVQRFRVYGFDREGRVVREVSAATGDRIEWSVHVANTKAAWYGFNNPLDMGSLAPGLPGQRRNQFIGGADREKLLIDAGPVRISGRGVNAGGGEAPYQMAGDFWVEPYRRRVPLGELRTDGEGRLLVFPGDGDGASVVPDNPVDSFSDNDGWFDDWCDGWVKATVYADGGSMTAEPAWVACCGPNFAPEIPAFITLYDVIKDVMIHDKQLVEPPALPLSFRRDVYPLFRRLGLMVWVSAAARHREGWIEIGDFLDPGYMRRLADPSPGNAAFRRHVFEQFRDPDSEDVQQYKLPYMLGSGVNYDFSPAHWFLMPRMQYWILGEWAAGNFVDDYEDERLDAIAALEDVPLEQQPAALTQAALEPCSGGAFHPGVELTWPMRQGALYRDDVPFRIALGNRPSLLQDVGRLLTPARAFGGTIEASRDSGEADIVATGADAPIGPQMPGDLTRWLGLPWHGDAFSCQFVIFANDFPNATWWPALLPIDVLPEAYYRQFLRDDLSPRERLEFFEGREHWSRGVAGIGYHANASYIDGLARMVDLWSQMGFVVKRQRPENLPEELKPYVPEEIYVEVGRGSMDLETGAPPNRGLGPPGEGDA